MSTVAYVYLSPSLSLRLRASVGPLWPRKSRRAALLRPRPRPPPSADPLVSLSSMPASSSEGEHLPGGPLRRPDSPNGSPAGGALPPKTSSSSSARQNQVTPLAPLEFLQNQRRGSITDPSLHAASPPAFPSGQAGSPFRRPESPATAFASSASHEHRRSFSQSRPLSPFKFGDASAQPADSPNSHFKRLLRSPSAEMGDRRAPIPVDSTARDGGPAGPGPGERHGSEGESIPSQSPRARGERVSESSVFVARRSAPLRPSLHSHSSRTSAGPDRAKGSDHMDVDNNEHGPQHPHASHPHGHGHGHAHGQEHGGHARADHGVRDMEDVEYGARRPSVVAGG